MYLCISSQGFGYRDLVGYPPFDIFRFKEAPYLMSSFNRCVYELLHQLTVQVSRDSYAWKTFLVSVIYRYMRRVKQGCIWELGDKRLPGFVRVQSLYTFIWNNTRNWSLVTVSSQLQYQNKWKSEWQNLCRNALIIINATSPWLQAASSHVTLLEQATLWSKAASWDDTAAGGMCWRIKS